MDKFDMMTDNDAPPPDPKFAVDVVEETPPIAKPVNNLPDQEEGSGIREQYSDAKEEENDNQEEEEDDGKNNNLYKFN